MRSQPSIELTCRCQQIMGAVLNMSHFLCPGSSTAHYIFGPPTSFHSTCADLSLDVLAEIPIEPTVSARGDQGSPIVVFRGDGEDGERAGGQARTTTTTAAGIGERGVGGGAREAFLRLGEQVWGRLK